MFPKHGVAAGLERRSIRLSPALQTTAFYKRSSVPADDPGLQLEREPCVRIRNSSPVLKDWPEKLAEASGTSLRLTGWNRFQVPSEPRLLAPSFTALLLDYQTRAGVASFFFLRPTRSRFIRRPRALSATRQAYQTRAQDGKHRSQVFCGNPGGKQPTVTSSKTYGGVFCVTATPQTRAMGSEKPPPSLTDPYFEVAVAASAVGPALTTSV